jgi:hypothetical protein
VKQLARRKWDLLPKKKALPKKPIHESEKCEPRHGGLPRPFGAHIGVVGEDQPSPQRGAFAQLAACIRQDKAMVKKKKTRRGSKRCTDYCDFAGRVVEPTPLHSLIRGVEPAARTGHAQRVSCAFGGLIT